MAANLIAQLQNEFSDDVIGRLASYLGETPAKTQRAVSYAIPAVVGGLFQKAQASGGAQDLLETLQRGGFDGKSIGNMASLARSPMRSSDLVRSGGTVVSFELAQVGPSIGGEPHDAARLSRDRATRHGMVWRGWPEIGGAPGQTRSRSLFPPSGWSQN